MANYKRKSPCDHCPFRTDIDGYLTRERAQEIAQSLAMGAQFPCHETTVPDENESDMVETPKSQFCAGALIMMEKSGYANQPMRIAERFGEYDAQALDMAAPVARNAMEFVDHHSDQADEFEMEPCNVVNMGCEAPAGILLDGMVLPAEATGETHICEGCGESVCDNCAAENGMCPDCAEYE